MEAHSLIVAALPNLNENKPQVAQDSHTVVTVVTHRHIINEFETFVVAAVAQTWFVCRSLKESTRMLLQ